VNQTAGLPARAVRRDVVAAAVVEPHDVQVATIVRRAGMERVADLLEVVVYDPGRSERLAAVAGSGGRHRLSAIE